MSTRYEETVARLDGTDFYTHALALAAAGTDAVPAVQASLSHSNWRIRRGCAAVLGYVDDAEVPRYLAATDVCLCLRWPTARETSATWLRALAAGKATIVTDLAHLQDAPLLPAARLPREAPADTPESPAPIAVAVDIWDEEQELPAAMLALARDATLRRRCGDAARAWWAASARMEHSAEDYERVMAAAAARPTTRYAIPRHLNQDGGRHARRLLAPFGLLPDILRHADTE